MADKPERPPLKLDPPKPGLKIREFISMMGPHEASPGTADDFLERHIRHLEGVEITQYIPESVTEAMIFFNYKGYKFSVDNAYVSWSFEVHDATCPDEILIEVANHCAQILEVPPGNIQGFEEEYHRQRRLRRELRDTCTSCPEEFDTEFKAEDGPGDIQAELSAALEKLAYPNPDIETATSTSDERTYVCPSCGKYHRYSERTPGGSDDAMVTYVHRELFPVNPAVGFWHLYNDLQDLQRMADRNTDWEWIGERATLFQKGYVTETERLKEWAVETVEGALEVLRRLKADTEPSRMHTFVLETLIDFMDSVRWGYEKDVLAQVVGLAGKMPEALDRKLAEKIEEYKSYKIIDQGM